MSFVVITALLVCVTSGDMPDPRRLQFDTTQDTTFSPTTDVTPGPTPDVNTLDRSADEPYILVDFGNAVSWDEAQSYCETQLGSNLASVWRNETTVLSEQDQIDRMVSLSEESTGSVWIGLRHYPNS